MPAGAEGRWLWRHYLCDMENVQNRWARISGLLRPGDRITIFVSDPASKFDLSPFADLGPKNISFSFCRCENGRPNAMDFQIMCELGRLSMQEPNTEFALVTSDRCFESVTGYMAARGVAVVRIDPEDPVDVAPATTESDVHALYKKRLQAAGIEDPEELRVYAAILWAAMALSQKRRKIDVMNRLTKRYGAKEGHIRYVAIKDLVHDIADNGPYPDKHPLAAMQAAPKPAAKPAVQKAAPANEPLMKVKAALDYARVVYRPGDEKKALSALNAARTSANPPASLGSLVRSIFMDSQAKNAFKALKPLL